MSHRQTVYARVYREAVYRAVVPIAAKSAHALILGVTQCIGLTVVWMFIRLDFWSHGYSLASLDMMHYVSVLLTLGLTLFLATVHTFGLPRSLKAAIRSVQKQRLLAFVANWQPSHGGLKRLRRAIRREA